MLGKSWIENLLQLEIEIDNAIASVALHNSICYILHDVAPVHILAGVMIKLELNRVNFVWYVGTTHLWSFLE